jgi:hypothetical protein
MDRLTPSALAAIDSRGDVSTGRLALAIDGMTCASCAGRVERALRAVPGVVSATALL